MRREYVWIPLSGGEIDRDGKVVKVLAESLEEAKQQVIDDLVEASLADNTDSDKSYASSEARDRAREQEGRMWLVRTLY